MTTLYHEGRSGFAWLKQGWHFPVAYVVGFSFMLLALGRNPDAAPN